MICHYFEPPTFLFYVPELVQSLPLLYYSHIPATILALIIGFFVFSNNPTSLKNRLLLLISLCFAGWTVINLIAWTNIKVSLILTIWPFFAIFSTLIAILSIYFLYAFIHNDNELPDKYKIALLLISAPVFIFAHTNLSVSGFQISDCDAFGFEGGIYNAYYLLVGILAMIINLVMIIRNYPKATLLMKKEIVYMGIGLELYLALFFLFTYIASYLTNLGIVENSDLEFYGLFGKTIFMVFVAIMIVRFKAFNVSLLASKALLIALIILTASQFTYIDNTTGIVLTALTLVITGVIGIALLRSVKNEIRQRSQLEILTKQLEKTNVRLKELDKLKSEFVSIASHQLRSPLTAIRGYASLVLEGSYGKIPEKAKEVIERIEESSKLMALGIEDYLNVSRIESGSMKYIMSDFNLRNETENLCDDLRIDAIKQGLVLIFRTNLKSKGIVNADIGKTVQVIQNLIHNAIKYTKKGSIKVLVRDDVVNKKIHIDIEDTGIGMSEKTIDKLFQKFERADNANSANISGTGLGLYVAVKMTEAMGGSISAHSEGDGKGSRFTITLPLAM